MMPHNSQARNPGGHPPSPAPVSWRSQMAPAIRASARLRETPKGVTRG
jgi:hypothetical protein